MQLRVEHQTEYHYSQTQRMVVQSHRLYPSTGRFQQVNEWHVGCEGATFGNDFVDAAGDRIRTMSVNQNLDSVIISINGVVTTQNCNGVALVDGDKLSPIVYLRDSVSTEASERLRDAAAAAIAGVEGSELDKAHSMCRYINESIAYVPGSTHSDCTADEALAQGRGVCQDQAHSLIAIARLNGVPARYVVGYLFTDADGNSHDASHAWAELHIDGLGWVGFDATNQCCPDERYIRISSGLDAQQAALIRGVSRGVGDESMQTSVRISGMQQ